MTISPGTNFDDPRFCDDERTPVQRMRYGDYYIGSRDSEMWIDDFELVYDYEE